MNMLKEKIINVLKEENEAYDKLQAIVDYLEAKMNQHPDDEYYRSFTWSDVCISYHILNKWIIKGIIKIYYKSNKSTNYMLIDHDITKNTLQDYKRYKEAMECQDLNKSVEVPTDIFDSILGMEDLKRMYNLSLNSDKPIHIAMFGPPATAKSLFLLELARLPNAYYAVGSSTTKSGISEVLFDMRPDILLIDEIDKLAKNPKELSVLLSLMETGLAKDTKHGSIKEIQLNTRVYAAGNVNNLPPELISRFIPLHLKAYSRDQFIKVATFFLIKAEKVDPDLAAYIANKVSDSNDVRMARSIARICKGFNCVDEMIDLMSKYSGG